MGAVVGVEFRIGCPPQTNTEALKEPFADCAALDSDYMGLHVCWVVGMWCEIGLTPFSSRSRLARVGLTGQQIWV